MRRRLDPGWPLAALLAALVLAAVPLAAPGPGLVPGSVADGPGWLRGLYGDGLDVSSGLYYGLLWAAFVAYLGVLVLAPAARRAVWVAIVALVAIFALAPPLLSQDVFSYISYARLDVEHGLSPYEAVPRDVPGDAAFPHVGWRDSVSAYGPAFGLATAPLGAASVSGALWALKGLGAAAVLAVAWLTARLAARRGVDPTVAAAFVALNPLVLVHVVGGAHNDSLMMLAVVGGIAAVGTGREAFGGASIVVAAAIKVSAAFAAPFALIGSARRGRLVVGALAAVLALSAASLAAFGGDVAQSVGLVGENQALTSRYSLPATVSRIASIDTEAARLVALGLYAVAVAGLLAWTWRGADWVRAAGWAGFGLLLATGWLLPWYLLWVLPLAAVGRDRVLAGGVLALTAFQLVNRVPI